ncbi:AAA family ATPase [Streptomyces sp. NPDC019531]|uniref:AAA family ATPase n=1 Tax=Streptomyces sp. NPDC019531 TaxID=3365062 RepID=UPI0038506FBE
MRRYVLTGTPGAGKTSILRCLAKHGYEVVEEAATAVIARARLRARASRGHGHPSSMRSSICRSRIRRPAHDSPGGTRTLGSTLPRTGASRSDHAAPGPKDTQEPRTARRRAVRGGLRRSVKGGRLSASGSVGLQPSGRPMGEWSAYRPHGR